MTLRLPAVVRKCDVSFVIRLPEDCYILDEIATPFWFTTYNPAKVCALSVFVCVRAVCECQCTRLCEILVFFVPHRSSRFYDLKGTCICVS